MSASSDDWPTTVSRYRELFGAFTTWPSQRRGVNFMTPEVLDNVRIGKEVVEISTGVFLNDRIFGVTFSRLADGRPDPRDRMCESLEEARTYLMEVCSGIRARETTLP